MLPKRQKNTKYECFCYTGDILAMPTLVKTKRRIATPEWRRKTLEKSTLNSTI